MMQVPDDASPTCNASNCPSFKAPRKANNAYKDIAENVMTSATKVLNRSSSKYEN